MARPKKDDAMEIVSARVSPAMLKEIDVYVDVLRAEMPLLPVNRADAIRQLIALGLEAAGKKRKR